MSFLIVLSSLVPIWLAGDFVLKYISSRRQPALERFPLAFALGWGFTALALFYLSLFDSKVALSSTMIIVTIIALTHLWLERTRWLVSRPSLGLNVLTERLALFLIAVFIIVVAALLLVSQSTDLGFDGLIIWAFKAKVAFLEGGFPSAYFADSLRSISHLDYPVMLPSLEAWAYGLLGRIDEQAVKIIFPVFYFALLAVFWSVLDREWSLSYRWLYLVLLATVPYFASLAAVSGYADMPLMLYVFASFVLLQRWMREGGQEDLWLGATVSALSVWVKREGLVYWVFNLVMVCIYLFVIHKSGSLRSRLNWLVRFLLPAFLIVVPWLTFLTYYHIPNSDFAMDSAPDWSRLPVIADRLLAMWLDLSRWGGLWIIFFVVLIWNMRELRSFPEVYLVLGAFVPLCVLSLTFVLSAWVPYTKHIDLALERLCMDEVPFAWWFIAIHTSGLDRWLRQLQARQA